MTGKAEKFAISSASGPPPYSETCRWLAEMTTVGCREIHSAQIKSDAQRSRMQFSTGSPAFRHGRFPCISQRTVPASSG